MSDPRVAGGLFRLGENCCAVAHADRVAFLVDGADYFATFMAAAERAERSIIVLAWDFDSRTALAFGEDGRARTTLGEFLNDLARRRRKLRIHVLDWDYPMIFGTDREFAPLYGFGWKRHRRVHFRFDGSHPLAGSHHQKIVVIDDRLAFVGGLDLTTRRWDTPDHRPDDPRRIAHGKPYPPFHDLMIAVDGEAARRIGEVARDRWRIATGHDLRRGGADSDPWPKALAPDVTDVNVGIACTAPPVNGHSGVQNVQRLYLDMIARARRYIYIENQYFTSHTIGDALAARLAAPDGPEVVLLTRFLSHGWLEEMTMHVLRTRLIKRLREADRHGRFHVYYPHIEGLAAGTCIDLHSKMMAVDDEWLRVGSANLSNRSMGLDTECDLVVEAAGRTEAAQGIRKFRDRLLGEHLGASADAVGREIERTGSIHGAIAALGSERRALRTLDELPEWSDAVVNTVALADLERPVSLERLVEEFAPTTAEEREGRREWWKAGLVAIAAVLGLTLAWRYTPLAELITPDTVINWAEGFAGQWWAPLAIVAAYTPASVILFPRPLITLAAVVAFGPWLGSVYAMTGILLAAVAGYCAGRLFDRDTIRRIAGKRLNGLTEALRRRGLLAVTAVRLVPLAPFSVESMVAGAVRIRLWHLVLGTFLGMLPGVMAATAFGDQLEAALRNPAEINYWIVGVALAALAILAFAVRRWVGKTGPGGADRTGERAREGALGTRS